MEVWILRRWSLEYALQYQSFITIRFSVVCIQWKERVIFKFSVGLLKVVSVVGNVSDTFLSLWALQSLDAEGELCPGCEAGALVRRTSVFIAECVLSCIVRSLCSSSRILFPGGEGSDADGVCERSYVFEPRFPSPVLRKITNTKNSVTVVNDCIFLVNVWP